MIVEQDGKIGNLDKIFDFKHVANNFSTNATQQMHNESSDNLIQPRVGLNTNTSNKNQNTNSANDTVLNTGFKYESSFNSIFYERRKSLTRSNNSEIFKIYPHLLNYKGRTKKYLTLQMNKHYRILFVIDFLCSLLDITVVTILYFQHFSYVKANYILDSWGNTVRWICLFVSMFVSFLIIFRIFQKEKHENVKFLLNLRRKVYMKKLKFGTIMEILIHLIQPYPYVNSDWILRTGGKDIHYSASAILFGFGVLRLYVCVKVLKKWNFYSNDKSKRILQFFNIDSAILFLYKANIKARGTYTLMFILGISIYLFALIFKIYEDYDPKEKEGFSYIWNCLWFLLNTIMTIGYGEMSPHSMTGRIIGVVVCITGIFMLSLFVVALMQFTLLSFEDEKAYKEIDILHTQAQENNFIISFFNTYIKYKFWQFRKNKKIADYLIKKNRYIIEREAHLIQIRASLQKPFDLNKFCKNIRKNWDYEILNNKLMFVNNIDNLNSNLQPLIDETQKVLNYGKTCRKNSFKLVNLFRLMVSLGSHFELRGISDMKGDGIVFAKNFKLKSKEFKIKYKDKLKYFQPILKLDQSDSSINSDEISEEAENYSESYSEVSSPDKLSFQPSFITTSQ